MPYTVDDVQRLFKLLGQAVWYTQYLELVMTHYNALMKLQQRQECGEAFSETEVSKALSLPKTQQLDELIDEARRNETWPNHLKSSGQMFLKTKDWIIHECVNDTHLSYRKENSKKHFFGVIEAYIKDAKTIETEIFSEMESWLKVNGFDLNRIYPLSGGMLKDNE